MELLRPRVTVIIQSAGVPSLLQGLSEMFSNASPFLELPILQRLRFTNCWRLGRLRRPGVPITHHRFPPPVQVTLRDTSGTCVSYTTQKIVNVKTGHQGQTSLHRPAGTIRLHRKIRRSYVDYRTYDGASSPHH
jgi:hypothetical protein